MVTRKKVLAALAVLLAAWAVWTLFPSRTRQVKRQFSSLSEWVSKDGPEGNLTLVNEATKADEFFAPECTWEAPKYDLSGTVTPQEITRYYFAGRARFNKLSLKFYDLDIRFPEEHTARVAATASITGTLTDGGSVSETHEVKCTLHKRHGKWLFGQVTVVEVLKR
ncbi:MAG: hypothetical protein ACP5VF_05865 [Acidobacteriota bacterium]